MYYGPALSELNRLILKKRMVLDQEKINIILNEPILLALIVGPSIILLIVLLTLNKGEKTPKKHVINLAIKKESPKVVDTVDCGEIEKLVQFKDGKVVMCRCWKSKSFPYCDGSHTAHNKDNGDNVGPLIIKK
jgi:CDGSH-type Zn-finger protein